jgi:hypothetical protein
MLRYKKDESPRLNCSKHYLIPQMPFNLCHATILKQWCARGFCSGRGFNKFCWGQKAEKTGFVGGSPLIRGSAQFANEETRILIRLLRMYFPRNWEFGSALSKLMPLFWRIYCLSFCYAVHETRPVDRTYWSQCPTYLPALSFSYCSFVTLYSAIRFVGQTVQVSYRRHVWCYKLPPTLHTYIYCVDWVMFLLYFLKFVFIYGTTI